MVKDREFFSRIGRLGGLARSHRLSKPERVYSASKAGWCRSQLRPHEELRAQAAMARKALQQKRERQEESQPQPSPDVFEAVEKIPTDPQHEPEWGWEGEIPGWVPLLDDDRLPWEKP